MYLDVRKERQTGEKKKFRHISTLLDFFAKANENSGVNGEP
jgi:hypothetical protein